MQDFSLYHQVSYGCSSSYANLGGWELGPLGFVDKTEM